MILAKKLTFDIDVCDYTDRMTSLMPHSFMLTQDHLDHFPLTSSRLGILAFARGDVVFIFSFKIFYFLHRTGRYLIYFTVTICILANNCKQIDY